MAIMIKRKLKIEMLSKLIKFLHDFDQIEGVINIINMIKVASMAKNNFRVLWLIIGLIV